MNSRNMLSSYQRWPDNQLLFQLMQEISTADFSLHLRDSNTLAKNIFPFTSIFTILHLYGSIICTVIGVMHEADVTHAG